MFQLSLNGFQNGFLHIHSVISCTRLIECLFYFSIFQKIFFFFGFVFCSALLTVHCSFLHRFCLILQIDRGKRILYNIRHKHMYTCILFIYDGSPSFLFLRTFLSSFSFFLRLNVFYPKYFAVFSENNANAVIYFFICTARFLVFVCYVVMSNVHLFLLNFTLQ